MKGEDRTGIVITDSAPTISKVKGLFQTLTELQIVSEGEKKAGDYNPDVVAPFATRVSFSVEGVHTGFSSIIFTYIMLPIVIGVVKNYFPAFGKYEHTSFETFLLYALTFSPGAIKILFTAFILSQLYFGKTTRTVVVWFLSGLIPTVLIMGIMGIFIYLTVYSVSLSGENLYKLYIFCIQKNSPTWMEVYRVIYGLKMSIPKATVIFTFYILVEALVPIVAYFYAQRKTKARKKLLKKYEIDLESP